MAPIIVMMVFLLGFSGLSVRGLLLNSSMSERQTFVCPGETVTLTCQGAGDILEWFFPPIITVTFPLRYTPLISVGTSLTAGNFTANLTSRDGLELTSTLIVNSNFAESIFVFCRVRNASGSSEELLFPYQNQVLPQGMSQDGVVLESGGSDFNNGILKATIAKQNLTFDVAEYRIIDFSTSEISLATPDNPEVYIGVSRGPNTVIECGVGARTMCGEIVPPIGRVSATTAHSAGLLVVLILPVLLIFFICVGVIAILSYQLHMALKKSVAPGSEEMKHL